MFVARMRTLFVVARARFAMLGNSLFWASAAVLRAAARRVGSRKCSARERAADVADLTLFLALGIVAGALLVPRLIPIAQLRRARLAAYAMGVCDLAVQPRERLVACTRRARRHRRLRRHVPRADQRCAAGHRPSHDR